MNLKSFEQIGKELGLDRSAVVELFDSAMTKLRNHPDMGGLKDLLHMAAEYHYKRPAPDDPMFEGDFVKVVHKSGKEYKKPAVRTHGHRKSYVKKGYKKELKYTNTCTRCGNVYYSAYAFQRFCGKECLDRDKSARCMRKARGK